MFSPTAEATYDGVKQPQENPLALVMHMDHNPMQTLLRRQMGIDAFGLDGDDTPLWDSWADTARPREGEVRLSTRSRR